VKSVMNLVLGAHVSAKRTALVLFGPAEFGECLAQSRERQPDNIEVAAFDAWDVPTSAALDGVGAGFVERLVCGEIAGQSLVGQRAKVDLGDLDEAAALGVRQSNQGNARYDRVRAPGKLGEHVAGVFAGARLAEDAALEDDFGVRSDDDGGADGASGHEFRLGVGEALNQVRTRFAGDGSFVDGRGHHGERNPSVAENFRTTRGRGSENELDGRHSKERILHSRELEAKGSPTTGFDQVSLVGRRSKMSEVFKIRAKRGLTYGIY
jgi:hypothetical protein